MGKIADISKWQGDVDWDKAAQELDFCVLRASCGMNKDVKYQRNVSECRRLKIPFGAYHYVMAGTAARAREEAQAFVLFARQEHTEPAFWIADIEYDAQTADTTEPVCVAFLEELRAQGCEKIGLYINRKYKWAGKAVNMCDIMWIPHWGPNDGNVPSDKHKPEYPHDLWQYTSKGSLAGVVGNVDLNQLTGSKPLEYFVGNQYEEGEEMEENKVFCWLVSLGAFTTKEAAQEVCDKAQALGFAGAELLDMYAEPEDALAEGVEIAPSTWNVRKGPGTGYGIIGVAKEGEVYALSGETADGWVGILYGSEKAWISAKGVVSK